MGETVDFIVDGYQGPVGSFDLQVDCSEVSPDAGYGLSDAG